MCKYIFSLLFVVTIGSNLQSQTFKAGVVFGFTASQIRGDNDAGFNKPGLEGGLKTLVNLGEKTDLSLEILYSQRGAKEPVRLDGTPQVIFKTDYIAIPIIYSYKDWAAEDYFRLHFQGGLSYGRLINAELENDADQNENQKFIELWSENDLSIVFGATYFVNKNFGLTFKYNRSLFLLYNDEKEQEDETNRINHPSLLPFHLSFQGVYMF